MNMKQIPPRDRMSLANLLSKIEPDNKDGVTLVAAYLEINGHLNEAKQFFEKADPESRKKIDALFK
jgi:hypothetical protein